VADDDVPFAADAEKISAIGRGPITRLSNVGLI